MSEASSGDAAIVPPDAGEPAPAGVGPALRVMRPARHVLAWPLLGMTLLCAATLAAYHFAVVRPAMQRVALLDIAEIYRLKEAQFEKLIADPKATDADRRRALDEAQGFGKALETLLHELPARCHCVLLNKAAVIGAGGELPDLTAEAKRALGM